MEVEKYFTEVSDLIKQAKNRTISVVNHELIDLYWKIGEYINQKCVNSDWGKNDYYIDLLFYNRSLSAL